MLSYSLSTPKRRGRPRKYCKCHCGELLADRALQSEGQFIRGHAPWTRQRKLESNLLVDQELRSLRISESLKALGDRHPSRQLAAQEKLRQYMLSHPNPAKRPEVRERISAKVRAHDKLASSTRCLKISEHLLSLGDAHPSKTFEARARASRNYSVQHNSPTKPELMLYAMLDRRRFKLVSCIKAVEYGCPISADIFCRSASLIIQVDGCYWHECPEHGSGTRFEARTRDEKLTKYAEAQGWIVLRFWEHDIYDNLDSVVSKIKENL